MVNNKLTYIAKICRLTLGFIFIYHGLFPKILWLSSIEVNLVEASGVGLSASILSPIAGILEIILGLCIIFYHKSKMPIYIAVATLSVLLVYVAIINISLMKEAFNPITTNIPALVLCYVILLVENKG